MGVIPVDHSKNFTCFPVSLEWAGGGRKTTALIDSGAEENFIDLEVAQKWGIPVEKIFPDRVTNSLNGQRIGHVTHVTGPIKLWIS